MTNEENKGAEFREGELVSGLRCFGGGKLVEPNERITGRLAILHDLEHTSVLDLPNGPFVRRDSLRHEPAEQKARFYQRQPDVLPKTLPAGTEWVARHNQPHQRWRWRLRKAAEITQCKVWFAREYERIWPNSVALSTEYENVKVEPEDIDWGTVPLQDPPPARASADLPIGEFRYGITTRNGHMNDGVAVQGWVLGFMTNEPEVVILEFRNRADTTAAVRLDSLSENPLRTVIGFDPAHGPDHTVEATYLGDRLISVRDITKQEEHGPYCCCNACYLRRREQAEPVRPTNRVSSGYQGYDKPREIAICAEMKDRNEKRLSAMTLRERRKSEALRMIDRPMVAPKYPDGVLWEAFATPGWES